MRKHTEETLWHFHLCAPQTDEMLKVPSHWQIITACCTNGAVDKSAGQRLNKNFRIWGLAAFSAQLWSLLKMRIRAYEKHSGVYFGRRLLTLCRPDLMLLIGDSKFACIPKMAIRPRQQWFDCEIKLNSWSAEIFAPGHWSAPAPTATKCSAHVDIYTHMHVYASWNCCRQNL